MLVRAFRDEGYGFWPILAKNAGLGQIFLDIFAARWYK
jgi:hypothetical protein